MSLFKTPINEPQRDGRGHPLLKPVGMSIRTPYSRASGHADYLTDNAFLHRWQQRYLARAIGTFPDLAELAGAETYHTGLDPLDIPEKRRSGYALDGIIDRALDRMKIHEKADYGTAFHALTEPGNAGTASERMTPDVDSFKLAMTRNGIELAATEVFTANDTTMTAGTFDHLVRIPGVPDLPGYLISDKKTGRVDPLHWCVQLATYANGEPYDPDDDSRHGWGVEINKRWGLMILTPALSGVTTLYLVDIEVGWQMAQIASTVRDFRERKDLLANFEVPNLESRLQLAEREDVDALRTLWYAARDTNQPDIQARIEEMMK